MTQSDNLYTKYAEYILNESITPVEEIEWLINNLKPEAKETIEDITENL